MHHWGRLRVWGVGTGCCLLLVACGGATEGDAQRSPAVESSSAGSDAGSGQAGAETADPGGSSATGEVPGDGADVVVLDPGDEPRVRFVLDLTEGQRSTSTLQMTMTTSFNGRETPTIPMKMVTTTEVQEVTEEVITSRVTYDDVQLDDAGLPDEIAEGIESGLTALEGLAITLDQSPTGTLLDTRYALPDSAPPAAHQMVEQIANSVMSYNVPFPTDPVGEGASWEVVDTLESNGLSLSQTSTYVLEELAGDRYRISTEFEGSFDPAVIEGAELVRGSLSGTGETSGSLGALTPDSGTSEGSTTLVMKVGGRRLETVTELEMILSTEGE